MKSKAFHKLICRNGWIHIRTSGGHYIYQKDGRTYPVPYHGSKEVPAGLEKKIMKDLNLEK